MEDVVIKRLERKIDMLIKKTYRPLWVKATVITGLTGRNNQKMRQARQRGYIKWEERTEAGKITFWYDLHSLDELFIKNYPH
jgi:hypothetical protein